jgi:hypothetical protein
MRWQAFVTRFRFNIAVFFGAGEYGVIFNMLMGTVLDECSKITGGGNFNLYWGVDFFAPSTLDHYDAIRFDNHFPL